MDDGTERKPVAERGGHVGDLHVTVALRDPLTPLLQTLNPSLTRHVRAPQDAASQQCLEIDSMEVTMYGISIEWATPLPLLRIISRDHLIMTQGSGFRVQFILQCVTTLYGESKINSEW